MNPAREVIEVNFEELERLLERARQGPLGAEDSQKLQAALDALKYLIGLIGEKDTTISRLRALLIKPSTEKTNKVLERAGLKPSPPSRDPAAGGSQKGNGETKPGHGQSWRRGVSGRGANPNRACLVEAGGWLPALWQGKGLRTEGARLAHSRGGAGTSGGHRL
jgi:hypothetical protein